MKTNKSFRLILIKPSHYDNDGYLIRWWRGGLPSNSLACLYGIALECRGCQVLGADFDIDIEAIDENKLEGAGRGSDALDQSGRCRHGDAGRRTVQPVSALARYRKTVS